MAKMFRILGRVAGRAMKTQAVDHAISVASSYVTSELRLTDLRTKRALLMRKRDNHLQLLGRTFWRQVANDVDPVETPQYRQLIDVLAEIDGEIEMVTGELERRREEERNRRRPPEHNTRRWDESGETVHRKAGEDTT